MMFTGGIEDADGKKRLFGTLAAVAAVAGAAAGALVATARPPAEGQLAE